MPKGLICDTCGEWCSRARALRRHIKQKHGNNVAVSVPPSTDDDWDWLLEEVCSIDFPDAAPPPSHTNCVNNQLSGDQDVAVTEAKPEVASITDVVPPQQPRPARKKRLADASVQTVTTPPAVDHVRRRLWAEQQHTTRLTLIQRNPGSRPTCGRDVTYAQDVDVVEQRRICDCTVCVEHAIDVTRYVVEPRPTPEKPGIRYAHLPGLTSPTAAPNRLRRLDDLLRRRPESTFVACGCRRCIVHRNLLRSWTEALHLQGTSEVNPGGGRMSRP